MSETEVPAPAKRVEYSEEVVDRMLDELKAGRTLRAICKEDWAPPRCYFWEWEKDDINGLSNRYARARQIGWEEMADELLEIVDDGSNDWMEKETERGMVVVLDHENIQRSRLRADTRKWILSKRVPAFSDKITEDDDEEIPETSVIIQEVDARQPDREQTSS